MDVRVLKEMHSEGEELNRDRIDNVTEHYITRRIGWSLGKVGHV